MSATHPALPGAAIPRRALKSRWPARLDFAQSASGLILGYFLFGRAYPGIVSVVVATVFILFIAHAGLALRKFPINYAQVRAYRSHMSMMHHEDTTLWWWQVVTGFAMFFLASVHLYQMMMHPGLIGPFESADRVWSGRWWPLYLVLLFAVELHGGIGLYRLAVKWGWFDGPDPNATRRKLKKLKWALSAFFIVLGLTTGYEHRFNPGVRYVPAWLQEPPTAAPPAWWPFWLKEKQP